MAACTKLALLTQVSKPALKTGYKVTVVGVGSVGMAAAITILTQVSKHLKRNYWTAFKLLNII